MVGGGYSGQVGVGDVGGIGGAGGYAPRTLQTFDLVFCPLKLVSSFFHLRMVVGSKLTRVVDIGKRWETAGTCCYMFIASKLDPEET